MLIVENDTEFSVDTAKLEEIVDTMTKKEVECIFVDSQTMRELNLKERNIDKTTDVLSFPLESLPHVPLGSIVINIELAKIISEELEHSLSDECALLFIHGMLHLLGYDHETDDGGMRKEEEGIIKRFALPKSLICRNNGQ